MSDLTVDDARRWVRRIRAEIVERRMITKIHSFQISFSSHFCEALEQPAIDSGRTVAWFSIEELGTLVRRHRADDSIKRAIRRITRVDLIVVDLC